MRILVTGSSGLIGSEAVEYYDQQGHEVHGIADVESVPLGDDEADGGLERSGGIGQPTVEELDPWQIAAQPRLEVDDGDGAERCGSGAVGQSHRQVHESDPGAVQDERRRGQPVERPRELRRRAIAAGEGDVGVVSPRPEPVVRGL